MTDRQRVSSGAKWESIVGYCRAIRAGSTVYVAGTTAVDASGAVVGVGDAYAQTSHILDTIERALGEAGASLADVVRTRMYVTDISRWEDIARAHGERFRDHPPAATMVEVNALVSPDMLIEIEVEAVV